MFVASASLPAFLVGGIGFNLSSFSQQSQNSTLRRLYVLTQSKGPRVPVYLRFLGWPPLPHPSCPQQRPLLLLPPPKRSPRSHHTKTRQRPGLLLLRRLPLRLRSQHRPGTPHPRRCPRRCKTQSCSHRRLPRPNPHALPPHLRARIQQRLLP